MGFYKMNFFLRCLPAMRHFCCKNWSCKNNEANADWGSPESKYSHQKGRHSSLLKNWCSHDQMEVYQSLKKKQNFLLSFGVVRRSSSFSLWKNLVRQDMFLLQLSSKAGLEVVLPGWGMTFSSISRASKWKDFSNRRSQKRCILLEKSSETL